MLMIEEYVRLLDSWRRHCDLCRGETSRTGMASGDLNWIGNFIGASPKTCCEAYMFAARTDDEEVAA